MKKGAEAGLHRGRRPYGPRGTNKARVTKKGGASALQWLEPPHPSTPPTPLHKPLGEFCFAVPSVLCRASHFLPRPAQECAFCTPAGVGGVGRLPPSTGWLLLSYRLMQSVLCSPASRPMRKTGWHSQSCLAFWRALNPVTPPPSANTGFHAV